MQVTRLVTVDDVPVLTELARTNREFLAPWEPQRDDAWFTEEGQYAAVLEVLDRHANATALPHAILDGTGAVVGRITLTGIVRGAFQSCSVGYWVDEAHGGRGLATGAVAAIAEVAFGELGLHRVQAETLLHNAASQRVLERNGFEQFGVAPQFLHIAGRWQDHVLFQLLAPS